MNGKHIELFLVDGMPGGITAAEIIGLTVHVLSGPRQDLADILGRPETKRNGAYLLLGDDDAAVGGVSCYVGRTENFANRFRDHNAKKEFWDRVVLITSKDDSFNEGHWGYVEARLVELARQAARVSLTNDQTPLPRRLSEAQASDMEAFLAELQVILPVLGINVIRTRTTAATGKPDAEGSESPTFSLTDNRRGIDATAQVNGDEFTMLEGSRVVAVLEGSRVVAEWRATGRTDSTRRAYASLKADHEKLVADGSIRVEDGVGVLTRDIPFSSPSRAGAIALGHSCNGKQQWTWPGGSYAQWADRGLDE